MRSNMDTFGNLLSQTISVMFDLLVYGGIITGIMSCLITYLVAREFSALTATTLISFMGIVHAIIIMAGINIINL